MKKTTKSSAIFIMSVFISSITILTTGCSENKPKIQKDPLFTFIPYECKAVGKIDIASIIKIEDVSKCINDNRNLLYTKEIETAGLNISNIESVIFGIEINTPLKNTIPAISPTSDGVIIISTKSKVNIVDFIKIAEEKNKGTKFKIVKTEDKTTYILPAAGNNAEIYINQLNDKLIAIGTQKYVSKTVELFNNKGKSILENDQIMKLSNNTNLPDMLWLAAIFPDGFISKTDKNTPNIKNGIISVNYLNDCLKIGSIINCATKEDAQKALLPFQMASFLITMKSNNTVKAEDFSIKADNSALSLDIKLTKEALKTLFTKDSNKPEKHETTRHSTKTANISQEDTLKTSFQLTEATTNVDTNNIVNK